MDARRQLLLDWPSLVAFEADSLKVVAVGDEAQPLEGKTPDSIRCEWPLEDGVITRLEVAVALLTKALREVAGRLNRPDLVLGVPVGATRIEQRAFEQAASEAGARRVHLIRHPLAAALGAELDQSAGQGHLLLDLGGGCCDLAVVAHGHVVVGKTLRLGGRRLDRALVHNIRKQQNLLLSRLTAEKVKRELASAFPVREEAQLEVHGRDLVSGLPASRKLDGRQAREALEPELTGLLDELRQLLESTPPELCGDIHAHGFSLMGGLSQLAGLDLFLSETMGLEPHSVDEPQLVLVRGLASYLQ